MTELDDARSVVVRSLTLDDLPWVMALHDVSFSHHRSEAKWRWMYFHPDRPVETYVGEVDGQPICFIGRLYFDVWIDGRRGRLSRGGDLMTEPAARGGDRSFMMPKLDAGYDGVDASYGFPADHSFRVGVRYGRPMPNLGKLPQWVRWTSGTTVRQDAPRVPPFVGDAAVRFLRTRSSLASRRARRRVEVVELDAFHAVAAQFDDLATRAKSSARFMLVRDAAYVRWRWVEHPTFRPTLLASRAPDDTIDGYVAFCVTGDRGRIVDLVATGPSVALGLIGEACRHLERHDVGRILFELNDDREWVPRTMRRLGFLARGVGPNMTAEARSEAVPGAIRDRRHWYVTLADTDLI